MGVKVKSLCDWWMVALLSVASLGATSSDLRLVEAVEKGDKEAVRSLLDQHADVNASQADGATALHWAAHWDDLETAELLIRAGADASAVNDYGITPLSLACTNGNAAMVEKLLKAGADPNTALPTGETALMAAARTGNVEAVKSLLARGADVNAKETRQGQTALMWAVSEKHPEIARALIEHGADVHAHSKGGFRPLMFAAQQGDLNSARILLAAGANVNEAAQDGMSVLLVASASGHEAFSVFLLDKGADASAADDNGTTALHYAVQKGITTLNRVDTTYYTSHLYRPNMLELVKSLLAHGAKPNARLVKNPLRWSVPPLIGLEGATPFVLAAAVADVNLMRLLVASGADPLLSTMDNTTPLMVAAGLGRSEDRTDEEERSALEAVKLVVELGVGVNVTNENGQTALQGAARTGANAIIQFLVDKGAKMDVKDRFGQTPLGIAEGLVPEGLAGSFAQKPFGVHKSTANLLRKLGAPAP